MSDVAAISLRLNYLTYDVASERLSYNDAVGYDVCKLYHMSVTPIQQLCAQTVRRYSDAMMGERTSL